MTRYKCGQKNVHNKKGEARRVVGWCVENKVKKKQNKINNLLQTVVVLFECVVKSVTQQQRKM